MKKRANIKKRSQQSSSNKRSISAKTKHYACIEMFSNDMRKNGFNPPKYLYANGEPQHFCSSTDFETKDCWYLLRLTPPIIGVFGHCDSDIQYIWTVMYEDGLGKSYWDVPTDSKVSGRPCSQLTCKIDENTMTIADFHSLLERSDFEWIDEIPALNVNVDTLDKPDKGEIDVDAMYETSIEMLSDILSLTLDTPDEWFNIDEKLIKSLCAYDEMYSFCNNGKPIPIAFIECILGGFGIKREIVKVVDDGVVEGYMKKHLLEAVSE